MPFQPFVLPILISGETGTGKTAVASEIHKRIFKDQKAPFVELNVGELNSTLVASELFGHVKGAFTGASEATLGAFRAADTGTLFLDEIGELPLDDQPKLLRVIESGNVRPVGGKTIHSVKVQVIAATNRDLELRVKERSFRQDLLGRLAGLEIKLLPFRRRSTQERRAIFHQLLDHLAPGCVVGPELENELLTRPWPMNIRGLEKAIQAAHAVSPGRELTEADFDGRGGAATSQLNTRLPEVPKAEPHSLEAGGDLLGELRLCLSDLVRSHQGTKLKWESTAAHDDADGKTQVELRNAAKAKTFRWTLWLLQAVRNEDAAGELTEARRTSVGQLLDALEVARANRRRASS